jgi:uncharacterized repeat protein (TIGR03803 family)
MTTLNWVTKAFGIFLLSAIAAAALPAQTLTTLLNFDGMDGAEPQGGLIQGTDGNYYGITPYGGANANCFWTTCGTIFTITSSGKLTRVYSFCSLSDCSDGFEPAAGLVQGADGNFYGTTLWGGVNTTCYQDTTCGTVFKITPNGKLTTLYSFDGGVEGSGPSGVLVQGTGGDFYGATELGGAGTNHFCVEDDGCGTVFKITSSGTLTTLHSFDFTDGWQPVAGLVQDANEDFYGTTEYGGANAYGAAFKITPGGTPTTLHSFDYTDGEVHLAGLVQATDGNFYRTTSSGGVIINDQCVQGCGTVFKITPGGTLTTLHSFAGYPTEASGPQALIQGTDGNLYGATEFGGANSCGGNEYGCGTIFKITPSGTLTTLYSFGNKNTQGIEPVGALLQGTNRIFYGTTYFGGTQNAQCDIHNNIGCGTIFSLSVGLKPFVETQPTFGAVGTPVNILGTHLTSATGVTFNGSPAPFTVVVKTLITATVPVGATTGTVQVVTPNGNGLSNVPFTVLP